MQNIIQETTIHSTAPSVLVTIRFCILPETEELFNDLCEIIPINGLQQRQMVLFEKENLNLTNERIRSLIDKAIVSSKNLICLYYPPSPPASKWFDVIVKVGYENETETRTKAVILKHFDDKMVGEQKFIDPQEFLEKLTLEAKNVLSQTALIISTPKILSTKQEQNSEIDAILF